MDHISKILNKKTNINDINVNNKILNNDTNDTSSKYSLKDTFIPNTPKTQLAQEIASFLNDTDNYACFLDIVNKIGVDNAKRLLKVVKEDIKDKESTSTPVRIPAKYFVWKYRKGLY